jgi:PST family polysaccharide transporter
MMSLGQGRRYLQCGAFNAITYALSFTIGLRWGPIGVALAYAAANYIFLYAWMSWAFRGSPVSFRDFVSACAFPALFSLVGVAFVLVIRPHIVTVSVIGQIATIAATFVAVILCALLLTRPGRRYVSLAIVVFSELRK